MTQDLSPSSSVEPLEALVAEPARSVRRMIEHTCEQCGLRATSTGSFIEALQLAEARPLCMAVTAQVLPQLGGFALAAALKAAKPDATFPIVMVSADAARIRADLPLGPDLVLAKSQAKLQHGLADFISLLGLAEPRARETPVELAGPVLVADDDRVSRTYIDRSLRMGGADVTAVTDGREALGAVARNDFRLLVLDIEMPQLDGWEVIRRVRDRGIDTPAVAVTAHRDLTVLGRALRAGFDSVLVKPVPRLTLLSRCERYLSR